MHTSYFCCLLAALFSLRKPAQAQQRKSRKQLNNSAKIDSTFRENLLSLNRKVAHKQLLTGPEIDFCYVVSFMSGLDFDIESYSGTILLAPADVRWLEDWYCQLQNKITWENYQKGIRWLKQSAHDSPDTDGGTEKLKTLRIK